MRASWVSGETPPQSAHFILGEALPGWWSSRPGSGGSETAPSGTVPGSPSSASSRRQPSLRPAPAYPTCRLQCRGAGARASRPAAVGDLRREQAQLGCRHRRLRPSRAGSRRCGRRHRSGRPRAPARQPVTVLPEGPHSMCDASGRADECEPAGHSRPAPQPKYATVGPGAAPYAGVGSPADGSRGICREARKGSTHTGFEGGPGAEA